MIERAVSDGRALRRREPTGAASDQKHLAERCWLISPRTLEQWRWQGRGPRYLKIGGRVVYRLSDIETFESARVHTNTIGPIDLDAEAEPGDGNR